MKILRLLALFLLLAAMPATADVTNVPCGQLPALTGDTTTSAGSCATSTSGIAGVNQNAAWTTFTPTITCGSGTPTSYTAQNGRYKQLGKTIFVSILIKINVVGTCSGTITIAGLPAAANSTGTNNYPMNGYDGTAKTVISALVASSLTTVQLLTAAGGDPTATDTFQVNGTYETN